MDIKDKIVAFSIDDAKIHVFKEGIFVKIYNESAYLFSKYFKNYKVTAATLKLTGEKYFSVGFPIELMSQNFVGSDIKEVDEKYWIITSENFDISNEKYREWCSESDEIYKTEQEEKNKKKELAQENLELIENNQHNYDMVIQEMRNFRIEKATPIECMLFIHTIQIKLDGALSEPTRI